MKETYHEEYISYFTEMGRSLSDISFEIMHTDYQRLEHILYLYFFPEDRSYNHWLNELISFSLRFTLYKTRDNKYPKKEFYFKRLWHNVFENEDNYNVIDYVLEDVNDHMKSSIKITNAQKKDIVNKIKKYYEILSELASKGKATKVNVSKTFIDIFKEK